MERLGRVLGRLGGVLERLGGVFERFKRQKSERGAGSAALLGRQEPPNVKKEKLYRPLQTFTDLHRPPYNACRHALGSFGLDADPKRSRAANPPPRFLVAWGLEQ